MVDQSIDAGGLGEVAASVHYQDDAVTIHHANALDLPVDDASVDLVVTSPPYFGLRSYQDGGEHYAGQIGSEATPAEFVDALVAATREMVRVLKPSGSIWVNLGDKYVGGERVSRGVDSAGVRAKSLMGLPWRYALRCIDDLGLILRAEVIWSKPNGLPESVTDRVRRSHEQWFHFTKAPRYFSAVDEVREEHVTPGVGGPRRQAGAAFDPAGRIRSADGSRHTDGNPLGKLPGSVWEIPTQPLRVPEHLGVDHFAAFPMEWPRRIIRGWSPSGVCTACGEGRRPVTDKDVEFLRPSAHDRETDRYAASATHAPREQWANTRSVRTITGEACACPEPTAPTRPAVVLDPFGGTGTTALVARALGRRAVHADLSADYCRLAQWRVNDEKQLAKAAEIRKPKRKGAPSLEDLVAGASDDELRDVAALVAERLGDVEDVEQPVVEQPVEPEPPATPEPEPPAQPAPSPAVEVPAASEPGDERVDLAALLALCEQLAARAS